MRMLRRSAPCPSSAPSPQRSAARPARAVVAAIALAVAAALLAGCGAGTSGAPPGTSTTGSKAGGPTAPSADAASPTWVCRPGTRNDPCDEDLAASAVAADGTVTATAWPHSTPSSAVDCFYVLPTESLATTDNTGLAVTSLEKYIVAEQAAPFSNVCSVWAPTYRSQTLPTVIKGLTDPALQLSTSSIAYQSLLPAWRSFLAQTGDRPIVLIGDSQGAAMLIRLVSALVDREPSVRDRLLVAILVGGNLQVPDGATVGATFTHVPLCTAAGQTGCAIAFSSFPSTPPANAIFGRPGQGVSLQSGETGKAGEQVACVDPTTLEGAAADPTDALEPFMLTATQLGLKAKVHTPWVTYPDLYTARCDQGGGASWLQISPSSHPGVRPIVSIAQQKGEVDTGPAWGYHGYEYGLVLGDLLTDVVAEEAAWAAHRG